MNAIQVTDASANELLLPAGLIRQVSQASGGTFTATILMADGSKINANETVAAIKAQLDAIVADTNAAIAGRVGAIHVDNTAVGNVGSGEDNLITYSLPANKLSVNGHGVRITAWGTGANNGDSKTLKMYFGSQVILTTSLTTSQVDTWRVVATVWRTGSNTQDYESCLLQAGTTTIVDVENGTASQTDTAPITIKCTGEATTNDDISQAGLLVELLTN